MKRLRIIEKDAEHSTPCKPYIADGALPLFYMSDYSVTGLAVDSMRETLHLLGEKGFSVNKGAAEHEVKVDSVKTMRHIFQLLRNHNIEFEMTDLVNQVYQG